MTGIPEPVDNLGTLQGYHSPQVDVEVRLNTNESPYGPPPEWVKSEVSEVSMSRAAQPDEDESPARPAGTSAGDAVAQSSPAGPA